MTCVLLGAFIQTSPAFDGHEHKHLGDLALSTAVAVTGARLQKCADSVYCSELRSSWPAVKAVAAKLLPHQANGSPRSLVCQQAPDQDAAARRSWSYGDMVRAVDYVLYPGKLYDAYGYSNGFPRDFDELNRDVLNSSTSNTLEYLRSSHNNEAHFQAHMLSSLATLHQQAIWLANDIETNTFGALVLNAMADHYLHDFFAPGHIRTPRDNFHDTFALGIHDLANNQGGVFYIDPAEWSALHAILVAIQDLKLPFACETDQKDSGLTYDADVVRSLLADHESLVLYGDGHLNDPDKRKQKLFMLLVEVRSIMDVFDSALKRSVPTLEGPVNHLKWFRWQANTTVPKSRGQKDYLSEEARLPFGMYEIAQQTGRTTALGLDFGPPIAKDRLGDDRPRAPAVVRETRQFGKPPLQGQRGLVADADTPKAKLTYPIEAGRSYSFVLGGSVAREQLLDRASLGRWAGNVEFVPFGIPGSPNYLRKSGGLPGERPASREPVFPPVNWGPVFGWNVLAGENLHAQGPSARLAFAFPKIESQFSLYARNLRYSTPLEERRHWGYGLRADLGFSVFTAFVAVGTDWGADAQARLSRGTMLTTGLTASWPVSRIGGLSRLEQRVLDAVQGMASR